MIRREYDLYAPLKINFEASGFTVRGEVEDCDLVATRGDDLVIVEMKTSFNLALVLQGIRRQQITKDVYLAIAAPERPRQARWRDAMRLCQRLGLGLLLVHFKNKDASVETVLFPSLETTPKQNRKKRRRVEKEFEARVGDFNVGGSTRQPRITAYRQTALLIANYLHQNGPSSVGLIQAGQSSTRVGMILRDNYYGWFERVQRGIYNLTQTGSEAVSQYQEVIQSAVKNSVKNQVL